MPEELKSCPFCGNKKIEVVTNDNGDYEDYLIECNECKSVFFLGTDGTIPTKEQMINAWNRRANNGSKTD